MRRSVRAIAAVVLIAGLTAGTVAGAQASVAEKKSVKKFCEKVLKISQTFPDLSGGNDALIEAARDFAKLYKKLAKVAPTRALRDAAKSIAGYYERLADSGDPNSADANYTDEEIDAIATITQYNVSNCAASGVSPTT